MMLQTVRDIPMLILCMYMDHDMDHDMKLKFSSYVHLPSVKKMFVGEVISFEHGCYILAFEHINLLGC